MSARPDAPLRTKDLPERVDAVLAAAGIPPSKLGRARLAGLNEGQRDFYLWILRCFASNGRPGRAQLHDVAERLCDAPEATLARLARHDLVHLDSSGEIAVAYPFSGHPTAHRVRFPTGHETYAMCAIDALGIAPMFDQTIEVHSLDPFIGDPIRTRVAPGGEATWEPHTAAVGAGSLDRYGDACDSCCSVVNFFATQGNAELWFAERPQISGRTISMGLAVAAGRAVFGGVFECR